MREGICRFVIVCHQEGGVVGHQESRVVGHQESCVVSQM